MKGDETATSPVSSFATTCVTNHSYDAFGDLKVTSLFLSFYFKTEIIDEIRDRHDEQVDSWQRTKVEREKKALLLKLFSKFAERLYSTHLTVTSFSPFLPPRIYNNKKDDKAEHVLFEKTNIKLKILIFINFKL